MSDSLTTTFPPLVSFIIFAYNQENYIREAVEGALLQEYENLEIIISDDCSTDSTFEIINEVAESYDGPHNIVINRNSFNLGLTPHVNKIFSQARGEIIVLAAGDDISYPDRTSACVSLLRRFPECFSVLLSADIINNDGEYIGHKILGSKRSGISMHSLTDLLSFRSVTFGAGRAIRKSVYNRFPSIRDECPTEDTPLLLRSLLCGKMILSSSIHLAYRKHQQNMSKPRNLLQLSKAKILDQYISDIKHAASISLITLPQMDDLLKWAHEFSKSKKVKHLVLNKQFINTSDVFFLIITPAFTLYDKVNLMFRALLSRFFFSQVPH